MNVIDLNGTILTARTLYDILTCLEQDSGVVVQGVTSDSRTNITALQDLLSRYIKGEVA